MFEAVSKELTAVSKYTACMKLNAGENVGFITYHIGHKIKYRNYRYTPINPGVREEFSDFTVLERKLILSLSYHLPDDQ